MQNSNTKKQNSKKHILRKIISGILLVTLLLPTLSVCCFGVGNTDPLFSGGSSDNKNGIVNSGIGKFDSDETIAQLKKDFLGSINKDLIKKISDYELRGEVDVIISFSDASLLSSYSGSSASGKMTFTEYRTSSEALTLKNKMKQNQSKVLASLEEAGLVSEIKYSYLNIMDGAFVTTTYENIEAICDFAGVERVVLSNTYNPAVAVENPVYVYETGIFNSSNISFTGKGTIVAVLDTGCDYTHTAFTTHQVAEPRFDRNGIAALLEQTFAYQLSEGNLAAREVYYGNITKDKIAFGYDYADKDPDIMPFSESHGTHVAGVIGGKDDVITGVAIDTQFAIMKVFSDYEQGAKDGDIFAALEDSVILGVDAINMSLGTSCGFTREVDDEYVNEIYDRISGAGISLIVAASNDHSSGYGSENGNTNKTDNPDSATVGAPSTYEAAMSVASINGNKDKYMLANGNLEVFFFEAVNQSVKKYDFFDMLGVTKDNPIVEYEYVTIPGYGYAINYSGLELEGKIALVRRGDITFEEKVQYAYEAGAAGVIIYNNVFGDITMTVGNDLKIPTISIGKDEGDAMAAYPTGTLLFNYNNLAGPFMSDFSSWGPTPDLKLKPEITAHGGNILSAIPGGEYEELSGTSMAAPNMAGIVVLIRQYVNELVKNNKLVNKEGKPLTVTEIRDLVNQLCMSTATIALDVKGNPYSPRKQGAGIADIQKATTTPAYLYVEVDGVDIGKTKLELGDDPLRTGVYEMCINLKNISNETVSYRLGNITMTESVSTSDPEYVAEMAYILSNSATYEVTGGTFENGIVSIGAGGTATIKATLTLSANDKSYLNSNFANGMYVEGFLTFDNTDENGVDLNAPFLAFYGDWGEAPIFDLDYYEVETEAHNNAIDDDDKIKADYYATTPTGTYYYDYILPLGSYIYEMDESKYNAIPATNERAAVSYYADAISGIYGVFTGLLRGAKEMSISVVDTSTGKVVWEEIKTNCSKAHYSGGPFSYVAHMDIPMANQETGEVFGSNNTRFEVTMTAKLDWDGENRNSLDTYSFSFYVDYEAPSVVDAIFRTEYDKSRKENRYYVDLMVYDNHYAMSIRPVLLYDFVEDGEEKKIYSSLVEYPIPIYQENRGETTKVTLEITDYIDVIAKSHTPEGLTLYIDDYAMNGGIAFVPFPETESDDLEFMVADSDKPELNLDINATLDLTKYLVHKDTTTPVETDYLKTLTWTSSDESVVAISGGKIEALKSGTAIINVTGDSWKTTVTDQYGRLQEVPLSKSIVINVSENEIDNPDSSKQVEIEDLKFVSYETVFAFNSDIDYSEIGITGTVSYFENSPSISFYPSEKIKLQYALEPWNLSKERYTFKWSSSNPQVATVDENGLVTAIKEGSARITLQLIDENGKALLLAARCALTVKSEFIIENRVLVAYKGNGGEVVIPDDEGIMTIGSFAFCHFNLDNEKEVEKDENGYYDIDLKKEPLGNNTVTSVIIPEGVETIEKYAFYNCKVLSKVQLPKDCKTIGESAFANCEVLENINLDNVRVVCNYAFNNCESLTCEDLGGIELSHTYAIGDYAFSGARFDSVTLTNLSRVGVGAFADCSKLENVVLGEKTRIAESMFENTSIKEIVIYSDTISDAAFKDCTKLVSVDIRNDITYLGEEAFMNCSKLEEVKFGGVCEQIAALAFYACNSLDEFKLPNCNVIISDGAFASSSLSKLIFAENTFITESGVSVFDKVRDLTTDVSASTHYKLYNGALYSKDGSRLVLLLPGSTANSFEVPADVTEIADGAFSSNIYLTSVTFADGSRLESIGIGAFANCSSLRSITLPNKEIMIGKSAFMGTKALKTINLEKVKSLGDLAFEGSGITSAVLPFDGVKVGYGAFYGTASLKTVELGKGAVIGEYAFAESGVVSVVFRDNGATIAEGAFYTCTKLKTFDFANVSGKLGDFAFYGCVSLTEVNAPYITEVGEGCFADCYALESFSAENLEIIGDYAFCAYTENSKQGAAVETITAPKLRKIGEYAFYGCLNLKTIDLSSVSEVGIGAFTYCTSLRSVTLSNSLTEIMDFVFYGCTALSTIDLSHVVRIGTGAFYNARLPETLELTNVEYIGEQAFTQEKPTSTLKTLNAPKLTYIGDQAFCYCAALDTVNAPVLEYMGAGAFAYSAIVEFEISNKLNHVGSAAFEGCDKLVAFYTVVDGQKVYSKEYDGVMIKDDVLYTVINNGYMLSVYPMAKVGEEFIVADETVKIDYAAVNGNKNLKRVVLPEALRFIGNYAFYGCTNLDTVVFKSYYAPVLEGNMGEVIEITPDNASNYPGFDKLYKYDYYYKYEGTVLSIYYYQNFVDVISSTGAGNLTYVIPKNSSGYDSKLYKAYFLDSENEDAGDVTGPYAWAFIDAVNALPNREIDRFDEKLIGAAVNAYNQLMGKAEEKALVEAAYFEKFAIARSQYNVSVVENKLNHLFDMDNSKYSYDLVKEARALYNALTDAERAELSNGAVLEDKIAALATAMGKTLDFSKTYEEYFPAQNTPTEPPVDDTTDGNGGKTWVIILIVSASVVGVAAVCVAVFVFLNSKKKRTASKVVDNASENAVSENEAVSETDAASIVDNNDSSNVENLDN